jgi:hypothetical protein
MSLRRGISFDGYFYESVTATVVPETRSELVTIIGNIGSIHLKGYPYNVIAFGPYPNSE